MREAVLSKEGYLRDAEPYMEQGYTYLNQIDEWLCHKTNDSVISFVRLCQDEEFQKSYAINIEELAYASIFAEITRAEIQGGISGLFILHGNSVRELTAAFRELKFVLWEVEFECEDMDESAGVAGTTYDVADGQGAEHRLHSLISDRGFSVETVKAAIRTSSIDKAKMILLLSKIYLENDKSAEAISMLEFGKNLFPEVEQFTQLSELLKKNEGR